MVFIIGKMTVRRRVSNQAINLFDKHFEDKELSLIVSPLPGI